MPMGDHLQGILDRLSRRPLADGSSIHSLLQRVGGSTPSTAEAIQPSPHFLTTLSGCRITRWLLPILGQRPERRDCYNEVVLHPSKVLGYNSSNGKMIQQQLQPMDTIYVTYDQTVDFVQLILPYIRCPVLLISGQRENLPPPPQWAIDLILDHPNIRYWFVQNLPKYGGSSHTESGGWYHPKLASFPYGLKQRVRDHPLQPTNGEAYRVIFSQSLQMDTTTSTTRQPRTTHFYHGYVTVATNVRDRQSSNNNSSSSKFLAPLEYYHQISDSDYIWSPNGDRPECYRHYEALGLGTAPVTQWSRQSHRFVHLEVLTGCVYQGDNEDFDDDGNFVAGDPHQSRPALHSRVNRNVVLEEYWMDYVDVYTDQSWTWWNRYSIGSDDEGPITTGEILGKELMGLS
jgi:hypothetical protein